MAQPNAQHNAAGGSLGLIHKRAVRMMGAGAAKRDYDIAGHMAANCLDAGATSIAFEVEARGKSLTCTDNGAGMSRERWGAMIGMGDPGKLDDENTIGENGTAHTTYWMAYNQIEIWTAWADDPHCYHLRFTFDEAWEVCRTGDIESIVVSKTRKTSKRAKIKSTGCIIKLSDPYRDDSVIRVRARSLTKNIARRLSPWQLDMVTVNGKQPQVDFPKGEFIKRIFTLPGVGQIEMVAGFADKPVQDKDRSWGTWGAHVCNHGELLESLPDRLDGVLLPELFHPQLWFMIRVHAWKRFEGKHARDNFKSSLFTDASFEQVVTLVNETLAPEVRKRIRVDDGDSSSTNELITSLVSRLATTVGQHEHEQTDDMPGGRRPKSTLTLKPGRIALVCSQTFVFEPLNVDPEKTYRVDASVSGGQIQHEKTWLSGESAVFDIKGEDLKQIVYRAGSEEGRRYTLRVSELGESSGVVETARTSIFLYSELRFAMSPKQVTLEPGNSARFRAVNATGKHSLSWEFHERGRMQEDDDGMGVEITAPMEPGNYTVRCTAHDGTIIEGRARVQLPRSGGGGGNKSAIVNDRFVINGVPFRITPYPSDKRKGVVQPLTSFNHGRHWVIYFNFQNEVAQAAARNGTLNQLLTYETVGRIAQILLKVKGDERYHNVNERREALLRQVLAA